MPIDRSVTYDRAIYHFKKNIDSLVGDQIYERFGLAFLASVGSLYHLTWVLSERGEFNEATIHGDEAIRIAEVANHPFSLNTAYLEVGYLYFRKGAMDKAIASTRAEPGNLSLMGHPSESSPSRGCSR